MATITDTGNYPDDDGFVPANDVTVLVTGGTTISATFQFKDSEGVWADVPEANATISGDWGHAINGGRNIRFRINVTAVTGTWKYTY